MVLACTLSLMGMSCPEPVGPGGLIPPGDYRVVRVTPDKSWEVPVSRTLELGCGQLIDARLLIDEAGSVVYGRTIRYVQDGQARVVEEEFRGKLEMNSSDREIALRWGSPGRDYIRKQVEPLADDPDFTVLYVDHFFAGNASCPGRSYILRYTIGGVNH
jgi:hypothetical protein